MSETIADRLRAGVDGLTRAERQLSTAILENYPVSGLGTLASVAAAADVSAPTVARMVQKLGYSGFGAFQAALREELAEAISDPIAKRDIWAAQAPQGHILNRFTEAMIGNIRTTLAQIETEQFDAACRLLADPERAVFTVGGRITRALADYFFLHMQVLRPRVTQIQAISNAWPHYLLDMAAGDVLVVFDVRRYETGTLKLAEMAAERGVKIVLITDQWRSPVARLAEVTFACRIAVPSAWDSAGVPMLLLETMIAGVQEMTWPGTRDRMTELEKMFDETRLFRKFI